MAFLALGLLAAASTAAFSTPPRSIPLGGGSRLSVLTSRVVRLELGGTEDGPTITFPHREAVSVPTYSHTLTAGSLTLSTADVELRLALPVSASSLGCDQFNVTLKLTGGGDHVVCPGTATGRIPLDPKHPGVLMDSWTDIVLGSEANLNGSVDTTDCYCGADCCYHVHQSRMQKGLLSRDGFSAVDDSTTALWDTDQEWEWRKPRAAAAGTRDLYFFLHGHDFRGALADFVSLAGRTPLKPWRTHGVWWSREYPFSRPEITDVIEGYASRQLPLNMLVLDYQWHYGPGDVQDVKGCNQPRPGGLYGDCVNGFGGYVWNKKLFPDPLDFTTWLHDEALSLVLNIHDPCGIDVCQEGYNLSAPLAGIDPASKAPIPCEMLNQTYATSLTERLLEAGDHAGVDYWWEDYGIGGPGEGAYKVECTSNASHAAHPGNGYGHCMSCWGDDPAQKPALWSAYVHGSRLTKVGRRALLLGINGGLGHHRYPGIGSGDVYEGWQTLYFEIYLSFTAANTVTEWNHDLGGFMPPDDGDAAGPPCVGCWYHNPERYARWLQAGVFQGIFRTHMSAPGDPTPWKYSNFPVLREAFQLRNALGPYIYTAAFQAYQTGVLPCHPLYYDFPEEEMAYTLSTLRIEPTANSAKLCVGGCDPAMHLQHSFGNDFVVSPIVSAAPLAPLPPTPAPPLPPKICKATAAGKGMDTTAPPIIPPLATSTADACAAACCANKECSGYTFDPAQDDPSGEPVCKVGKPCCWLKHGTGVTRLGRKRLSSGMLPDAPPAPPPPSTGETTWPIWVPPGQWVDWWSGALHTGPLIVTRNWTEREIPLLVRAGAIIPMKGLEAQKQIAAERLILEAIWAPGVSGTAHVYEDAGDSLDYQHGVYALTNLSLVVGATKTTLTVAGGSGQAAAELPTQRRFACRFRGAPETATGWQFEPAAAAVGSSWWWEAEEHGRTLVGVTALVDSDSTVVASFTHSK